MGRWDVLSTTPLPGTPRYSLPSQPSDQARGASDADLPSEQESTAEPEIDFVTLGMFIIDDIDFKPPVPSAQDIIGGAGSYAAVGARLFSPPPMTARVGWIVDRGSDFPCQLSTLIHSWATSAVLRDDISRLTTRGWNGYVGPTDERAFKYTTPKKRLTAADLTPSLLMARSFHLICSPARCQELVADITMRRKVLTEAHTPALAHAKPIFVWEPVPDLCTPDELLNCTNALRVVDVCSPNHTELAGFMGHDGIDHETGKASVSSVESACEQLLASMPLQSYSLVVRVGAKGCYIARNGGKKRSARGRRAHAGRTANMHGALQPDTDMEALFAGLVKDEDGVIAREEMEADPGMERWIPAYHQDAMKVVDPTGGGNAFLGGLAVAMARGRGIEEAAIWGSVSASFAVEQVGVPNLMEGSGERWNKENVMQRLAEFQQRLAYVPR